MNINLFLVKGYIETDGGWLRFPKRGFSFTCGDPLFSERLGIRGPLFTIGKWRVFKL